jgi:hypothetical protein
MLDNKFLDKVVDQIISETRVIDNKLHTPFHTFPPTSFSPLPPSLYSPFLFRFSSHCKEVYNLNKEETEYVWTKYKKEVTTLMDKK